MRWASWDAGERLVWMAGRVTEGPFAVSRDSGYVGDLVLIASHIALTDSRLAAVARALRSVWFLLAPFAEEPWLEEHYGDAYREYKKQCPRFLGQSFARTPASEAG